MRNKKNRSFALCVLLVIAVLFAVSGTAMAKYVDTETVGSFDLTIESPKTFNLTNGPDFNAAVLDAAPDAESIVFGNRTVLGEAITGLTPVHVGATDKDAVYLYVSGDGKTAYIIADTDKPEQKIIANENSNSMFLGCSAEAIDISELDTSNTVSMNSMFAGCAGLTSLDLTSFDTASLKNADAMFKGCENLTTVFTSNTFAEGLESGDSMFDGCTSLIGGRGTAYDSAHVDKDYALIDGGPLRPGYFTDREAPEATYTLMSGENLNAKLKTVAPDMTHIEFGNIATHGDKIAGLTPVHVGAGENDDVYLYKDGTTVYIIAYSHDKNQKVTANEKSNVMFAQLSALTSVDAANLDAANVTDMNGMFMESENIESVILSGLDTSKVENMADMFKLCTDLSTLDLTGLSTESVSDMSAMFDGCSSLATIYASESFVIGPDTAHGDMFAGCASLAGGMGTAYDPDHTDGAYARIDDGLGGPGYFTDKNAPAVTYTLMDGPSFNELLKSDPSAYVGSVTFGNRATLADIIDGLSSDNFIHVGATENDKVYMVEIPTGDVQKQVYVIADSFNGSTKIAANENSAQMFYQCDKLTGLDLSVLDVSQVKNMGNLFAYCSSLTQINMSGWNTSAVTAMNGMFAGCSALTNLDVSGFNTASVTRMDSMFSGCTSLSSINVTGFDTSKTADLSSMFNGCAGLTELDLTKWNTANAKNAEGMFAGCSGLKTIYASKDLVFEQIGDGNAMFDGCGVLVGGMGTAFDAAHIDKAYAHIDGGSENPGYFTARYVVTLDPNNGDDPTEIVVTGGEEASFTIPQDEPTQDGYRFTGWEYGDTAPTVCDPGETITITGDTTLTAKWAKLITLSFDANGGTGAPEAITFAVGEDRTVETPADQLTRVGHTFAGWNTSAAGDGTMYEGVFTTTGFTDNTTLYAQWTPNTYTITFNANGGSGAPAQQSWVYADSGTIALSSTKPTRTGYTFQGWAASAAATSAAYQPGQAWNRNNTQSCTLYAVWKANTYTVAFNANGGSGAPAAQTKTYGVTLKLSSTKPTRAGYTFTGWNTAANGSGTAYAAGANYTANSAVTLYAQWKLNTYKISFDARGGSGAPGAVTKTHGVSIKLPTTKPTRSGYTFVEWNTKADGTGTAYAPGATYTGNANATLYARWRGQKSYTVKATSVNPGYCGSWTSNYLVNYVYNSDHNRVGRNSSGRCYAQNLMFNLSAYKNKTIKSIKLYVYVADKGQYPLIADQKLNGTKTSTSASANAWATVGVDGSSQYTKRVQIDNANIVEGGWNVFDMTAGGIPTYGYCLAPHRSQKNYHTLNLTGSYTPYVVIVVEEEM